MKRLLIPILLFPTLFYISSCGDIDSESYQGKMSILVLCDLSSSLDTNSRDLIANKSASLIKKMPFDSKIIFYPTEENTKKVKIFSFEKQRPRKPSERSLRAKETMQAAKEVSRRIKDEYDKGRAANPDSYARSCIWSNIVSRISWFHDKPKDHCRYMVILSDMIEECTESPIGKLFMKQGSEKKIRAQIAEKQMNTFADYQDVMVSCIGSPSGYSPRRKGFLPTNITQELWGEIFSQMGYEQYLSYEPDLPETLTTVCNGK